jgi:L-seryl-tRNA(Ser) seleniumtransferase
MTANANPFRALPSVDRLLAQPAIAAAGAPPALVREAIRSTLADARAALRKGELPPALDSLIQQVLDQLAGFEAPSLRPVINATGVILHTNLGRAPLSRAALAAMQQAGRGYSNLEYDLEAGTRGSRFTHLEALLRRVTGAEAGIAVNNNASAMLLALSALCAGREVIVSRGQAVEIGGGFRIPDVLRQSGATLVEVGTTNRTNLRDFEAAISDRTAAILRVHASNFRVIGFTAFPALGELVKLAHAHGLLLLDDLGSGCLIDTRQFGMLPEPMVQESVTAGVDVAAFSGDKLLGGPQAGVLVGRGEPLSIIRRHPLTRAVRMDKTSIAALSATLQHYARGEALTEIPIWRMIAAPLRAVEARARRWARGAPCPARIVPGRSMVGGGSLPEEGVETRLLALDLPAPARAAAGLRGGTPPIIARIHEASLLLDPRTVDPADDAHVAAAVQRLQPPSAAT